MNEWVELAMLSIGAVIVGALATGLTSQGTGLQNIITIIILIGILGAIMIRVMNIVSHKDLKKDKGGKDTTSN